MDSKKNVIIVGESNSLKSRIIIEYFLYDLAIGKYNLTVACHGPSSGIFVDYIKKNNIDLCFVSSDLTIAEFPFLSEMNKDVCFVLAGWPYIVKKDFINNFPSRVINCHGSYLPDYKGSRAYMHYWANIEDYYGVSIHYVSESLDEGRLIKQVKIKQFIEENPVMIHRRMAEFTGLILDSSLELVFSGYEGVVQEGVGRYFQKISKDEFYSVRKHNEKSDVNNKIQTPHSEIIGN